MPVIFPNFNFEVNIYTPQRFDKKKMKSVNVTKIGQNTYLKLIEKINSEGKDPTIFNLLLRYFKEGSHYDFLQNKNCKN